jgi:hypothetical protein
MQAMKSHPKNQSAGTPSKPLRGKKTWNEKLMDDKDLPKVAPMPSPYTRETKRGTMLIPAPREVNALMRRIRKGRLTTIDQLRTALAAKHKTTMCCPITTGIFAWIAAHAADESATAGKKDITPFWRTLKTKGELNPKYPGGLAAVAARLKAEGHEVIQKGKRCFVSGFEKSLAKL